MANTFEKVVSLFFSERCFREFFYENNFADVDCMKMTFSKVLGNGIILGSTLVKLPQIIKLFKAKSSEGISFTAVLLELIGMTSSAAYSYAKNYPFSSWGESLFLLIETAVIGFMVLLYGGQCRKACVFSSVYTLLASILFTGAIPIPWLWSLQVANLPIVITGKLIQAVKNYQSGHTGQLSPATVFLLFLGSCARIFTSVQETGDPVIVLTFLAASLANGLLAGQILYYWDTTARVLKAKGDKKTQ